MLRSLKSRDLVSTRSPARPARSGRFGRPQWVAAAALAVLVAAAGGGAMLLAHGLPWSANRTAS